MITDQKVDILAFGVHPDDVELFCAGTILKHIDAGHKVGIMDLTRGELGTLGNAEIRTKEANTAAEILGVSFRNNLEMRDVFFQIDEENIRKVAGVIRRYKPKIIFANALEDRHPDHGRAAQLIREASYYSGLVKIEIEDLEPWRPKTVYHYIQDHNLTPDILVDVTAYVDRKFEAIMAFSSQFYRGKDKGAQTPISTEGFQIFLKSKMATYGRAISAKYAEAFNVTRAIGVEDLTVLH